MGVTRLSAPHALALHTQTSNVPAHSVSIVLLEPSVGLTHDQLSRWVASTLTQAVQFRSRLVEKPLGVGQPVWSEIAGFDPARRLHCVTAPAPGGDRELFATITRLVDATNSSRALWQAWTIDGLSDDRWALVVKLSTVLSDGGAGVAEMWKNILSGGPGSVLAPPADDVAVLSVSPGELVADAVSELVENQLAGAWMVTDLVTSGLLEARRRLHSHPGPAEAVGGAPAAGGLRSPATTAPLTHRRSIGFVSVPTSDLATVSDAFGGDLANVFLAACAVSLQTSRRRHGAVGDEPLSMVVPLSLAGGTSSAVGEVRMPARLDGPVHVLTAMHTATERLNLAQDDCEKSTPAVDLATAVALVPPRLARLAAQAYTALGLARASEPRCHARVSFLPGPLRPAFCAGSAVVGMFTAAPLTQRCDVTITATIRNEAFDVCVSGCPDNPWSDAAHVTRGITDAVGELSRAAGVSPRGEGQSVVTELASHSSRYSRV